MLNPAKDFKEHVLPYQVDHRGAGEHAEVYFGRQRKRSATFPRPTATGRFPASRTRWRPAASGDWFRSRIIGGRTNHYGRISLRFSDYDFQPEDGLSDPWPVTYDEMSPWYDKAEGFIGVTGTKEGLRTAPDGNFLPPIPPRVHETLIQKSCAQAEHSVHPVAHGDAHQIDPRPRGVPLLRAVRARLPDGVGVHLQPGHDFPRHEDRQAHHVHGRDGARAGHRRLGQGDGGLVRG